MYCSRDAQEMRVDEMLYRRTWMSAIIISFDIIYYATATTTCSFVILFTIFVHVNVMQICPLAIP